MYGLRIRDMHDRYVGLSQKAVEGLLIIRVPGRFWIEHLPIMRYIPAWVPGFSAAQKIRDLYKPIVSAARNELYERIEFNIVRRFPTSISDRLTCLPDRGDSTSVCCTKANPRGPREVHWLRCRRISRSSGEGCHRNRLRGLVFY